MLSNQVSSEHIVSLNELFPSFTQQFLEPFNNMREAKLTNEMLLDFKISERTNRHKISPILRLARPEDAREITEIYKELYNGTYPYKEMEDVKEVRRLIKDPNVQWIIYQDPDYNIAGCVTFILDFDNKRGYIRGFMLKKKYQGYIDITKAMIGSMLGMIQKYKNKIFIWYVENRTAHSKSQYSMWVCGIAPIGFYPNKDVFFGKVESDLMQILYDKRALYKERSPKIPAIIQAVEECYLYSQNRYHLGDYRIKSSQIILDYKKIKDLKSKLTSTIQKDNFGYENITFSFKNRKSYFQFMYTPTVSNFEKTSYQITSLEELFIFVQEFVKWKKKLKTRYCEVYISAYQPEHQQIFYDIGLRPRGYVPSWKFNNKNNEFEDFILFNWYQGQISDEIQLIQEGWDLVDIFQYECLTKKPTNEIDKKNSDTHKILELKNTSNRIFLSPKTLKSCLISGLILFLALIGISILIAQISGDFSLMAYTISSLGSIRITPLPFLFDMACMIGGFTTILFNILLFNQIYSYFIYSQKICSIFKTGFLTGIIGSVAIIMIGIFSLDRAGPGGLIHGIFAILAFAGYVVSIFISSYYLIFYSHEIANLLGCTGLVGPLFTSFLNCFFITPILEWILLFSILIALIPQFFIFRNAF